MTSGSVTRKKRRRSSANPTVDAVRAPRMCLCLPPLKAVKLDLCTEREWMDGWVTASSTPASAKFPWRQKTSAAQPTRGGGGRVSLRQRGEEERRGNAEIRKRSTIPDRTAVTSTPRVEGGVGGRVSMPRSSTWPGPEPPLPGGTSEAENMRSSICIAAGEGLKQRGEDWPGFSSLCQTGKRRGALL